MKAPLQPAKPAASAYPGHRSPAGRNGACAQHAQHHAHEGSAVLHPHRCQAARLASGAAEGLRHRCSAQVERPIANPEIPGIDSYRIGRCSNPFRYACEQIEFNVIFFGHGHVPGSCPTDFL